MKTALLFVRRYLDPGLEGSAYQKLPQEKNMGVNLFALKIRSRLSYRRY